MTKNKNPNNKSEYTNTPNSINQHITKLEEEIKKINKDKQISPEEKKKKIQELEKKIKFEKKLLKLAKEVEKLVKEGELLKKRIDEIMKSIKNTNEKQSTKEQTTSILQNLKGAKPNNIDKTNKIPTNQSISGVNTKKNNNITVGI